MPNSDALKILNQLNKTFRDESGVKHFATILSQARGLELPREMMLRLNDPHPGDTFYFGLNGLTESPSLICKDREGDKLTAPLSKEQIEHASKIIASLEALGPPVRRGPD